MVSTEKTDFRLLLCLVHRCLVFALVITDLPQTLHNFSSAAACAIYCTQYIKFFNEYYYCFLAWEKTDKLPCVVQVVE